MTVPKVRPGWGGLLVLFSVASFVEAAYWSHLTAFTPLHLPSLGVGEPADVKTWTGVIASVSSFLGLPLLPFWGALADRYGKKPVVVRSFAAHLVAGLAVAFATSVPMFVVGRAIQSFSLGNSGLMMATLGERAPPKRVGFVFSIFNAAGPIGALVGPLLGGPVVDRYGLRALVGVDAVLLVVVIGALSFGYSDPAPESVEHLPLFDSALDSLRIVGRSARLRLLFPALFLLFAGWMLAFTYVPLVVESIYAGPDVGTMTGVVSAAGGVATMALGPLVGALGDRRGHAKTLLWGSVVTAMLWPLPALVTGLVPFTVLWAILNGLSSATFALSFTVLSNSAPEKARARVMTFAYVPANVGLAVGPAIGSWVTRSSLAGVFPTAAGLTALGIGALALAMRKSQER